MILNMIRSKLDAGTLPHDAPAKLWAGLGTGQQCTICEEPIENSQAEYEPQYDDDRPTMRLHAACHALWNEERQRRSAT
jgi:hypothetical protein